MSLLSSMADFVPCDRLLKRPMSMMRFVMTFDDALRDSSRKFIVLNFHFYWYCLSLKANFQKKNYLWKSVYQRFPGSLEPSSGICCVLFLTQ